MPGRERLSDQIWTALVKVCTNGRLIVLILIITGFWMVQHQLYATMPKYVTRLAGEASAIGWYANVNPLVVVLTVNLVTSLMRKKVSFVLHDLWYVHHADLGFVYGFREYVGWW